VLTQDDRKKELIRALLGLGTAGLGIGVGARAAMGIHSALKPTTTPVARSSSLPEVIPIPSPSAYRHEAMPEEEEKLAEAQPLRSLALALVRSKQADLAGTIAGAVPKPALDAMPNIHNTGHPVKSWYGLPAAMGVGAAGLTGGWSLMDLLLKSRRKAEIKGDVEDARGEFRKALADEYQTAMMAKTAEEGDPLETAYQVWQSLREKEAFSEAAGQSATDWANLLGGIYLTAAGGIGGTAAYGTYKWTKNRNAQSVLRKAIEARKRARQAPKPILAVPTHDITAV